MKIVISADKETKDDIIELEIRRTVGMVTFTHRYRVSLSEWKRANEEVKKFYSNKER